MYSKYDKDLKVLMIGFEKERLLQLINIIDSYWKASGHKSVEAKDLLAFLSVAQFAMPSNMPNDLMRMGA